MDTKKLRQKILDLAVNCEIKYFIFIFVFLS